MQTAADPMPAIEYAPGPCPKCKARTLAQAETLCKPTQDETGEYSCAGGDREDAAGNILQPTAASIAALDAWIDRHQNDCPPCNGTGEDQNKLNDPGPCQHCHGTGKI